MSNIQLSEELLLDIQKTLIQHDEQAQDMGVAVQYLSAIIGLMLANFKSYDTEQKKALLSRLAEFSEHVMLDNESQEQKQQPTDEAFGIWKP